ncbi:MAG: hypothetical protein HZA51_03760 [Planctomycetes bacterium]|nr:hypothetical protein [Planctomycetota bacterium]
MNTNPEKLTCISIVVCDDVYRDEQTKKLIVVGVFNTINAPTMPCAHGKLVVLFTLTNGKGEYNLELAVEHEQSGTEIVRISGPLRADDPLAISDVNVTLANLVFEREGKYWVVLKADGAILQQRPLYIKHASE